MRIFHITRQQDTGPQTRRRIGVRRREPKVVVGDLDRSRFEI